MKDLGAGGPQSVDVNPTLLSLPPDARCWWSGDHLRPHTSCRWPCSLLSAVGGVLTSRWRITRSRLPDDSCSPFHARAPGRRREEQRVDSRFPAMWRTERPLLHTRGRSWEQAVCGRLSLTDLRVPSGPPGWSASSLRPRPRSERSPCGFRRPPDSPARTGESSNQAVSFLNQASFCEAASQPAALNSSFLPCLLTSAVKNRHICFNSLFDFPHTRPQSSKSLLKPFQWQPVCSAYKPTGSHLN